MKRSFYSPTLQQAGLIGKSVITPKGLGTVINFYYSKAHDVICIIEIEGERNYFPASQVELRFEEIKTPQAFSESLYQAMIREAANTPTKQNYISNKITLNEYCEHEKSIYGNA